MWIIGFNNILYRRNNQIRLIAVYAGINGGLVLFYGKPGMNIWKTWTEDFGKPGIYILEIGNLFGIIITRRQNINARAVWIHRENEHRGVIRLFIDCL